MQTFIFLQSSGSGSSIMQMLPLLLIFVVFWFFIIRPQMKKQKDQNKFAETLEKGKEVVTSSGIFGKIIRIDGEIVYLEIAKGTVVRITKGAISKEMSEVLEKGSSAD